jgi:hypothetical protein
MAKTNSERVGEALKLLNHGLAPYIEREFQNEKGKDWQEHAKQGIRNTRDWKVENGKVQWDSHLLLSVLWNNWNLIFSKKLGKSERSLVSELQTIRNRWAHQEQFSNREAYRAIDSVNLLLHAVGASEQVRQTEKLLDETARVRIADQARNEEKKILRFCNRRRASQRHTSLA